jgi:hypothetical protein
MKAMNIVTFRIPELKVKFVISKWRNGRLLQEELVKHFS